MTMTAHALRAEVATQCDALGDLAARANVALFSVKPHGALYHAANEDMSIAQSVVGGAVEALGYEISMIGPPRGALAMACEEAGIALLGEGFADRAMRPDGSLVPRSEPGALITDASRAAEQARVLVRSGTFRTLCVHGDTPGAEAIARAVREALGEVWGPS